MMRQGTAVAASLAGEKGTAVGGFTPTSATSESGGERQSRQECRLGDRPGVELAART